MMVVFPFAWWQGEGPLIASAVGISLISITTLAAVGAILPLLFDRMRLDPALMSSPFITTVTDIAGIYLSKYCKMVIKLFINLNSLGIYSHFCKIVDFCLTLHFLMVLFTKQHSTFMSSETLSENKLAAISSIKASNDESYLDLI